MSDRMQRLRGQLTVLASSATEQLRYLEEQNLPECIDELALDYDAIAATANDMLSRGEVSQQQRNCVKALNDFLGEFSGQQNAHLWTPEALRSAPEWEKVRRMATECLAQLK